MSNINVKKKLESISNELAKVLKQVAQYSGVDARNASAVDNHCSDITEMAARIAAEARLAQSNSSGKNLVKKVRRALGYTTP